MKKKYKKGDRVYKDFEGEKPKKSKLRFCYRCEQWVPPPYLHSCHNAAKEREFWELLRPKGRNLS